MAVTSVTYPKCFTYVVYVWSPQETVDGLQLGPWGGHLFHSSVCHEEAERIMRGEQKPHFYHYETVIFGLGVRDYLLSIGCTEDTVERVEAERKAARDHSTERGVTIKLD
jgi:hypothetical protein